MHIRFLASNFQTRGVVRKVEILLLQFEGLQKKKKTGDQICIV
jgi:hypothetical protein